MVDITRNNGTSIKDNKNENENELHENTNADENENDEDNNEDQNENNQANIDPNVVLQAQIDQLQQHNGHLQAMITNYDNDSVVSVNSLPVGHYSNTINNLDEPSSDSTSDDALPSRPSVATIRSASDANDNIENEKNKIIMVVLVKHR